MKSLVEIFSKGFLVVDRQQFLSVCYVNRSHLRFSLCFPIHWYTNRLLCVMAKEKEGRVGDRKTL
jgi:hypothetical protein